MIDVQEMNDLVEENVVLQHEHYYLVDEKLVHDYTYGNHHSLVVVEKIWSIEVVNITSINYVCEIDLRD